MDLGRACYILFVFTRFQWMDVISIAWSIMMEIII
jgi:hypothetical protein